MATRRTPSSSSGEKEKYDVEKDLGGIGTTGSGELTGEGNQIDAEHSLHRGLKARHITMIAIGGAIGTGLIIGT